jgi:predicted membrane metal-binding protein
MHQSWKSHLTIAKTEWNYDLPLISKYTLTTQFNAGSWQILGKLILLLGVKHLNTLSCQLVIPGAALHHCWSGTLGLSLLLQKTFTGAYGLVGMLFPKQ